MKKKMALFLAGGLLALSLTGCAENQIPEVSDEQMAEIKNRVAVAVMKYNMGRKSRLVDLSKYSDPETLPGEMPDKPQGMDPVEDTPVIDTTGNGETKPTAPGESGNQQVSYRLEEVLGLPEGVTVSFENQEICDNYGLEGEEDIGFFMGASSESKKLLVLHFQMTNTTAEEKIVDLGFPEVVYQITVNGEYTRKALTSMLLNDLATFDASLPAESSADVVLVIEVDKDMEGKVSSIDLNLRKEQKSYQFKLL